MRARQNSKIGASAGSVVVVVLCPPAIRELEVWRPALAARQASRAAALVSREPAGCPPSRPLGSDFADLADTRHDRLEILDTGASTRVEGPVS